MIGSILTTLIIIIIGLLFIDLVPLQESMICKDYNDLKTCPEAYYSQSYIEARRKFRKLAQTVGAEVSAYPVIENDEDFTIDVAVIKRNNTDESKVIVHMSGTHGVEGFAGSAIQISLLSMIANEDVNANITSSSASPSGIPSLIEMMRNGENKKIPTIVLVHAVNPYGFSLLRRNNENNVDLNRNQLTEEQWKNILAQDHDANLEKDKDLFTYQRAPNLFDRYFIFFKFGYLYLFKKYSTLRSAFMTGQYSNPQGLFFGGNKTESSLVLLKNILAPHIKTDSKVISFDVHTGLGKTGEETFIITNKEDVEEAKKIWKKGRIQETDQNSDVTEGYSTVTGIISVKSFFPETKKVLHVVQEFGTVLSSFVAREIILENAAYNFARDSFLHQVTKMWLRDAFYPQNLVFKIKTLRNGISSFEKAFHYLQQDV